MAGPGTSQEREPIESGFVPAARDRAAPWGLAEQRALAGEAQGGGQGRGSFHGALGLCLSAWTRQEEGALAGVPCASLRRCGLGAFLGQG